jgi:hypothetical protein
MAFEKNALRKFAGGPLEKKLCLSHHALELLKASGRVDFFSGRAVHF